MQISKVLLFNHQYSVLCSADECSLFPRTAVCEEGCMHNFRCIPRTQRQRQRQVLSTALNGKLTSLAGCQITKSLRCSGPRIYFTTILGYLECCPDPEFNKHYHFKPAKSYKKVDKVPNSATKAKRSNKRKKNAK